MEPDRCHGHPRPAVAAHADLVVFVRDGRINGELPDPTAELVFDQINALEA